MCANLFRPSLSEAICKSTSTARMSDVVRISGKNRFQRCNGGHWGAGSCWPAWGARLSGCGWISWAAGREWRRRLPWASWSTGWGWQVCCQNCLLPGQFAPNESYPGSCGDHNRFGFKAPILLYVCSLGSGVNWTIRNVVHSQM